MTPTFNPTGAFFNDVVLIRSCKNNNQKVEELVGQVVYVQRKERRLIKRLTQVDSASQTCWLQSDNSTGQYYDSNIFGFVPCDCILGHVQGIVWPLHRIKKLPWTSLEPARNWNLYGKWPKVLFTLHASVIPWSTWQVNAFIEKSDRHF